MIPDISLTMDRYSFSVVLFLAFFGLSFAMAERTKVRNVKIVAHRGAPVDRPENTMPAFERAVELGADVVEIDIRASADGRLFSLHDSTLDRTTEGSGPAAKLTFEELRELDAGGWFGPKHAGEKIPSLAEVLEWARERTMLLLDLKDTSPEYNEAVAAEVEEFGNREAVVIGVRTPDQARHFRKLIPGTRQLAFIRRPDLIEEFADAGTDILRLWLDRDGWLNDNPDLANRVRKTGRKLMINGTVGDLREARALMRFKPDWILIDDVMQLKRSLEKMAAGKPTIRRNAETGRPDPGRSDATPISWIASGTRTAAKVSNRPCNDGFFLNQGSQDNPLDDLTKTSAD